MKQIYFAFFSFITLLSFSQENYSSESYNVTLGDIETKTFIKDSTANALVIYEEGNSYIDKNEYDLRTEVKHKIKILNQEGFNNANVTIYLYNNDSKSKVEKVEDIIAVTYNKIDGQVVKTRLLPEHIFKEEFDKNRTLVKFTLPNIKEGSVITYSYKLISPFMFKYKGWYFQSEIPKLYSEYKTSIPGFWLYHGKIVGRQKFAIDTSVVKKNCMTTSRGAAADCANSTYAMKDIPAFIEEDYMTAKRNHLSRIEYELKTFRAPDGNIQHYTKSWKDVDKEFRTDKEVGKQLRKKIELEDLLNAGIINETNPLKKAQNIYKEVQNNYTWNGEYDMYKNVSIKNIIKNKYGNVLSVNILLHNILKEAGISVKPVLLSTREHGFPTTIYPVYTDFNYLIVQATINNKTYLLDATDNYLSFGEIPLRCLNGLGRLMDFKEGSKWLDIEPSSATNIFYQANLNIDSNGTILGNIKSKRTGYHALTQKKAYFPNPDTYIENLENKYPYIEISDHEVTDEDITSPDFKENYNIEYIYDESGGNNIYLNPFFIKFFNENPFKLQERTYPIDFGYKYSCTYVFKLQLNDNFTVTEIPKGINLVLPNKAGQVLFSTKKVGKTLNLLFKISFNKAIYEPEYYPYLKEFMSKIVGIQNNSIILLKKSN